MTANDDLLDSTIRHLVLLQRLHRAVVLDRTAQLARDAFDPMAEVVLSRLDQLKLRGLRGLNTAAFASTLDRLGAISNAAFVKWVEAVGDELIEHSLGEAAWNIRTIRNVLPTQVRRQVRVYKPTDAYLRAVRSSRPLQGRTLREWANTLDAGLRARIAQQLRTGMLAGESASQLVTRLRGTQRLSYTDGVFATTKREAATVVRTSLTHVAARARDAVAKANEGLVTGVRWVSTLDVRTSEICIGLDGQVFPVDSGERPPAHPNACSEGTRIATAHGPIPIESVRVGDLVWTHAGRWRPVTAVMAAPTLLSWQTPIELQTSTGRVLRVTHEHPILTTRGWRQAREIEPGDHVFEDLGQPTQAPFAGATPVAQSILIDAANRPSMVDEPAIAFTICASARGVSAAVELERQGVGDEGEVDHRARSAVHELRHHNDGAARQHLADLDLMPRLTRQIGGSPRAQYPSHHAGATDGVVGSHLRSAHGAGAVAICDGDPVQLVPRTTESLAREVVGQGVVGDAVLGGELRDSFVGGDVLGEHGPIDFRAASWHDAPHATRIVAVRRNAWHGAIFNLAVAGDESYVADGVVVHNCRSTTVLVLAGWQELGIEDPSPTTRASMTGQVPATLSYPEWFRRQPAAIQRESTLGAAKAAILRRGIVPASSFVDSRLRPLRRAELEALEARLERARGR